MLGSWIDPEFEVSEFLDSEVRHMFMNERGEIVVLEPDLMLAGQVDQSFLEDVRKVVIPVHQAYFHLITEVLTVVVEEIKKADLAGEKIQIVLISNPAGVPGNTSLDPNHISDLLKHAVRQIERAGHSAAVGSFNNRGHTAINNFSVYKRINKVSLKSIRAIADFMSSGVEVENEKVRTRKIYLTRKKTLSNSTYRVADEDYQTMTMEEIRAKYQYKINNRVDDELALEEYFESLGFEIICPEDIESYEDQIRLMMETRKVVSLTSAGLTSMIYMKPNGAVVELVTPLITGHPGQQGDKSLHPHYYHLSHELELSYLAIPHSRIANEIIERIEKTPGLRQYLSA